MNERGEVNGHRKSNSDALKSRENGDTLVTTSEPNKFIGLEGSPCAIDFSSRHVQ